MKKGSDSERPRGILTQTDREFLVGNKENYSNQQRRDRRKDIRERIYHSLLDLGLLWLFLDSRDIAQIFQSPEGEINTLLRKSVQDMLAFAVLGMIELGDNRPLRIAAALLQVGTVKGRYPIEFSLRYPSTTEEQQVGWKHEGENHTDNQTGPRASATDAKSFLEETFFDAMQIKAAVTTQEFARLNYLDRERALDGEIDVETETLARAIKSFSNEDTDEGESVEALANRLAAEQRVVQQLPVQRRAFSYPMDIDQETGKIIWAADIEDYEWYSEIFFQ